MTTIHDVSEALELQTAMIRQAHYRYVDIACHLNMIGMDKLAEKIRDEANDLADVADIGLKALDEYVMQEIEDGRVAIGNTVIALMEMCDDRAKEKAIADQADKEGGDS